MKKMFVIILILSVIFIGMVIYKNNLKAANSVTIEEVDKIEKYISKIYMWKEVTKDALPTFDNINDASILWLWGTVQKNLDNYESSYEEIQEKAKDLFGADFTTEFPKEGTSNFIYNEETQRYNVTGINLDAKEDMFLLNKISKTKEGYEVEIVEYLENYIEQDDEDYYENTNNGNDNENDDNAENKNKVIVENLNEEQISTIENKTEETQVQQIVKENLDKFSKKKIILKKDNENLYVEKVEK